MNAFYVGLKRNAHKVSRTAVTASRLKRFDAIEAKLRRFADGRRLTLERMQDIAGCRAVMESCEEVDAVVRLYTKPRTPFLSRLIKENDYIQEPRATGYRSHHLIYEYRGRAARNQPYAGLRVELQIRTKLQHAWAAAVETVDLFTHQDLKTGGGTEPWRTFFGLMGSYMAEREGRPPVVGLSSGTALRRDLRDAERALSVLTSMAGWRVAIAKIPPGQGPWHLLEIDVASAEPGAKSTPFRTEVDARVALDRVEKAAKGRQGFQVVLVQSESVRATRLAYPAYFADTANFAEALRAAILGD
jgi:hypothetical protein